MKRRWRTSTRSGWNPLRLRQRRRRLQQRCWAADALLRQVTRAAVASLATRGHFTSAHRQAAPLKATKVLLQKKPSCFKVQRALLPLKSAIRTILTMSIISIITCLPSRSRWWTRPRSTRALPLIVLQFLCWSSSFNRTLTCSHGHSLSRRTFSSSVRLQTNPIRHCNLQFLTESARGHVLRRMESLRPIILLAKRTE